MRNTGNSQRQGATTAAKIHEQAVQLFYELGYHPTSLRRIAGRVGVLAPSIYNHFSSKEELFYTIVSRTMRDLTTGAIEAVAGASQPTEKLRAFVEHMVRFHGSRRIEAGVTDNQFRYLGEPLRNRVIEMRDELQRVLEKILEEGVERGEFTIPDIKITAYAILTMTTYVALWYRPAGRLNLNEIARQYADLALRMVDASGLPRGGGQWRGERAVAVGME